MKEVRLISDEEHLAALSREDRGTLARRIYTFVEARKRARRVDLFNAQYGMNRGIAAGFLLITLFLLQKGLAEWRVSTVLLACAALALFRMQRFSEYYSGELIRQFLGHQLR